MGWSLRSGRGPWRPSLGPCLAEARWRRAKAGDKNCSEIAGASSAVPTAGIARPDLLLYASLTTLSSPFGSIRRSALGCGLSGSRPRNVRSPTQRSRRGHSVSQSDALASSWAVLLGSASRLSALALGLVALTRPQAESRKPESRKPKA